MPEHHIARHLAARHPVLVVDPPVSLAAALRNPQVRASLRSPRLRLVQRNLARLIPVVQPGMRRSGLTFVTERLTRFHIRRALSALRARPSVRILASDLVLFEPRLAEYRVLYATDDFEAGAQLFGVSRRGIARNEARLQRWAQKVIAVSPLLADHWRARGCDVAMIPNGCDAERFTATDEAPDPSDVRLPRPIAGFTGQINDRIDLSLVEAVADTGHSLLFVGPISRVSDRGRLERLFGRPNVQWVGGKPYDQMTSYLKMIDVGLTPYANTPFNQASMPLKTIEYLAAGRAVVASDLAGARFLATDLVTLASSPAEFAEATRRLLKEPARSALIAARRTFAAKHSWSIRAGEFAAAIGLSP
jgi:teichuronic acid biosynthesis glycosyltransferase TuaH